MYVKAATGLVIRDPDLMDLIPAEGREVPASPYWVRRLNDGDVVLTSPPEPPPAPDDATTSDRSA